MIKLRAIFNAVFLKPSKAVNHSSGIIYLSSLVRGRAFVLVLVLVNVLTAVLDFFGRGYSDAPIDLPYDSRLYTSQILLAIASSRIPWTGEAAFHLIGYSLGGAIAASFASYHAHMVKSLTLVCPGGLIRSNHLTWKGKLLYSEDMFPERLLQALVWWRLQPRRKRADTPEVEVVQDLDLSREDPDVRGGAVFDNAVLSKSRPRVTVSDVISWQLDNHPGFVPAYMSTIRNAPIYEQGDKDWRHLATSLVQRRGLGVSKNPDEATNHHAAPPGLQGGRVLFVLGDMDPVIVKDEMIADASAVLGEDSVRFVIIDGGHDIAITKGWEVAEAVTSFFKDQTHS
jgi:pimeloyl-ACP methyl ester carboxylesterase